MRDAGKPSILPALAAFRLVSGLIVLATAAVTLLPQWHSAGGESFSYFDLLFDGEYASDRPYIVACLLAVSLAGAFVACAVGGDHLSELHSACARAAFFAIAAFPGLTSLYPPHILPDSLVFGSFEEGAVLNVTFAASGVAVSGVCAVLAQKLAPGAPRVLPPALAGLAWGMLVITLATDVSTTAELLAGEDVPHGLLTDIWLATLAIDGTMVAMALVPIIAFAFTPGPPVNVPTPPAPIPRRSTSRRVAAEPSDAYVASLFEPVPSAVTVGGVFAAPRMSLETSSSSQRCDGCGAMFSVDWLRVVEQGRLCRICFVATRL